MYKTALLAAMFTITFLHIVCAESPPSSFEEEEYTPTPWMNKKVIQKSILIYVMSTAEDSHDRWMQRYGGRHTLKPITNSLEKNGFYVTTHDRQSISDFTRINLKKFSQIWLVEADSNNFTDPTAAEINMVYGFFQKGGGVWLSGDHIMERTDACWTEDINALARPFGVQIDKVVISKEQWIFIPRRDPHPLLAGINRLVFDDESGALSITNRKAAPLVFINKESRILPESFSSSDLFRYASRKRLDQIESGKKDWSWGWLLSERYDSIGSPAGDGVAGVAIIDERGKGRGRCIIDAGWVIGCAYKHEYFNLLSVNADNLQFIMNAAAWLAPAEY